MNDDELQKDKRFYQYLQTQNQENIAVIRIKVENMETVLENVQNCVFGKDTEPGLKGKVQGLEQVNRIVIGILLVVIPVLVGATLWLLDKVFF